MQSSAEVNWPASRSASRVGTSLHTLRRKNVTKTLITVARNRAALARHASGRVDVPASSDGALSPEGVAEGGGEPVESERNPGIDGSKVGVQQEVSPRKA